MRYRLAALGLIVVLPIVNAAPAPAPSAVVDIGPPPKGTSAVVHRQRQIECLTYARGMLLHAWHESKLGKLESVATQKDGPLWLSKNLRVRAEKGERHLRVTFQAGTREEQREIVNALARTYVRLYKEDLARWEDGIRRSGRRDAAAHDHVARLRQIRVVKWAK